MTESRKFVFNKVNVTKNNDVEPLKYYLDLQETILDKLTRVIQSEYEALRDRMVARLAELSSAKSDLMLKLQSNDQKIKLHPDVDKLKTEFAANVLILKDKLKKCKFRNEVNGRLIVMNMQASNKLKAVLMEARDATTRNMTYNAKGSASAKGPSRLSISA
ncbi:flagellar export chaperone FlgN [Succinivibrio sp.]|uniref:flagella synthesis protein FlgN n=1 Tax=Succinivibrio sp. TaxID=2053619 RepID=UPI002583C5CD|nr:flagellar export chaperone FlgN [Succinivibrio sp.]MCI6939388.1 flagellar protein FlgN [Succinatimonas hippei]MDD6206578.1 flagellar export chaperone FlgN [Succinivibrio sp.]